MAGKMKGAGGLIFLNQIASTVFPRPLKSALLSVLGVLPAVLSAQSPPLPAALPEDFLPGLNDILHSALQQSPQMLAHNIDLAAQEANRYQQAAVRWPSLSSNVSYAYNQSTVASNSAANTRSAGVTFGFTLTQPLYHWGDLQALTDIAHLQIKISERQYADAYRQLAATLRSQYLSLILKKVDLRNSRFDLSQVKASLADVEERFKTGAATSDEAADARLQLDETNLSMDRAVAGFAHSKRVLLLMSGLSGLSDDSIPEEIPPPVYSPGATTALLQDFMRDGVNKTFEAQIYDYEIKESDLSYRMAKHRLYPRFDMQLGVAQQNQTNASNSAISQTRVLADYIAVGASWNIFDGFATRGAKLAALASKRAAELRRQNYTAQMLEQARELDQQVEFSFRALAIAEKQLKMNEENLQRTKDDFKLGLSSQRNVDRATASFYQRQAAAFSARADFFSHWCDYLSLLGVDPVLNNLPVRFTGNAK